MRILAIDYGRARIGLAMSDPTASLAQAFRVLARTSDENAALEIGRIVSDMQVERIVVGLPRRTDGSLGERAVQCQAFADRLRVVSGLPVDMYDERFTTVVAERTLIQADVRRGRRKQVIDAVAATVLLQDYLDWKKNRGEL